MNKSDKVKEKLQRLIATAKDVYGEPKYKYYAIPVEWYRLRRRRVAEHRFPITGLDRYETTKEEWEKHKEQGDRDRREAYLGKLKRSYVSYEHKMITPGWREKLIELLKAWK